LGAGLLDGFYGYTKTLNWAKASIKCCIKPLKLLDRKPSNCNLKYFILILFILLWFRTSENL